MRTAPLPPGGLLSPRARAAPPGAPPTAARSLRRLLLHPGRRDPDSQPAAPPAAVRTRQAAPAIRPASARLEASGAAVMPPPPPPPLPDTGCASCNHRGIAPPPHSAASLPTDRRTPALR